MSWLHEIEFFEGCKIEVDFFYWASIPATVQIPSDPERIEINTIQFNNKVIEANNLEISFLELLETYLLDHYYDWHYDEI